MIKNVLLVDDDNEMLIALEEGFQIYKDSFSILLASDGLKAVESLKRNLISLVVTDLSCWPISWSTIRMFRSSS